MWSHAAAFTGTTGVKPTFGLVSTAGCIPITFSFDVVGPLARAAADCSALLSAMTGHNPFDRATLLQPTGRRYPVEPRPGDRPLAGTRIGVPAFPGRPLSAGVSEVYERFLSDLQRIGADLVPFAWPMSPLEDEYSGGLAAHPGCRGPGDSRAVRRPGGPVP